MSRARGPKRTKARPLEREGRRKGHVFRKKTSKWVGPLSKRTLRAVFVCEGCGMQVVQGNPVRGYDCDTAIVAEVLLS